MDSERAIEIYFFPFSGGGHQIPMIDMARLFSSHGANSTIIATASNAPAFQNAVARDRLAGIPIAIRTLRLDSDETPPDAEMSAPPLTDTSALRGPLERLLSESPPDCIVVDAFHRWASEAIDAFGVRRISFTGNGCFSRCVGASLRRFRPHDGVGSDLEPFVVPGLPDRIELTRSQLPARLLLDGGGEKGVPERMRDSEEKSFGVLVNSFRELEPSYAEKFAEEIGKKTWLVGPVSLCNRDVSDKVERGSKVAVDEKYLLEWLDSFETKDSVLYVSFGSLARVSVEQLAEIAAALESSGHPFVWVVGKPPGATGTEEWLPDGFEERTEGRGLVIRGWAPQLLILEHEAVGGFMTHCGWNSTLEGVSAGVAMATWPMSAEQFFNEKLVTEVLRTGVPVGSEEWAAWNGERKVVVGREKVAAAVRRVMGDVGEAAEMRQRAAEIRETARGAVGEGGSSWMGVRALISELQACRRV